MSDRRTIIRPDLLYPVISLLQVLEHDGLAEELIRREVPEDMADGLVSDLIESGADE